jgi:hypothetical protein
VALLFAGDLVCSMQFTALNTLAFAEVPQPHMGGANTLFNMAQQMAMGVGIATLMDFRVAFAAMPVFARLAVVDARSLSPTAWDELRRR